MVMVMMRGDIYRGTGNSDEMSANNGKNLNTPRVNIHTHNTANIYTTKNNTFMYTQIPLGVSHASTVAKM